MKKSVILLAAILIGYGCLAQKEEKEEKSLKASDIPALVKTAFAKAFPGAKGVEWSKENPTEFEAEFKLNGKEMSSNFDQAGKWVVTETEIKASELPPAVTASLAKELPGYKINESEKVETADKGTYYEMEMIKDKKKVTIEMEASGKVVKVSVEKEKED